MVTKKKSVKKHSLLSFAGQPSDTQYKMECAYTYTQGFTTSTRCLGEKEPLCFSEDTRKDYMHLFFFVF